MKVHKKNQLKMKPQETVTNEKERDITDEFEHGSDKGVGSDEITAVEEVFVESEGTVKVESVDSLDEENDLLNF